MLDFKGLLFNQFVSMNIYHESLNLKSSECKHALPYFTNALGTMTHEHLAYEVMTIHFSEEVCPTDFEKEN